MYGFQYGKIRPLFGKIRPLYGIRVLYGKSTYYYVQITYSWKMIFSQTYVIKSMKVLSTRREVYQNKQSTIRLESHPDKPLDQNRMKSHRLSLPTLIATYTFPSLPQNQHFFLNRLVRLWYQAWAEQTCTQGISETVNYLSYHISSVAACYVVGSTNCRRYHLQPWETPRNHVWVRYIKDIRERMTASLLN